MDIPNWVDAKKRKSQKPSARLKYILANLAARHTGRQSMRALAEKVGLDHSTLSLYIRRGSFSVSAAERIQTVLGAKEISAAVLITPMAYDRTVID